MRKSGERKEEQGSAHRKAEISQKEKMLIKLEVASRMKQVQKQISTKRLDEMS